MFDSSRVESCSTFVDSCSTTGKGRPLSSVAAAYSMSRELGAMLAPQASIKAQVEALYRELAKRLPTVTRRRVRAFFFGEAARVDYEEMRAFKELRAEEELKRARRQLAATADILAAHHAETGAPLDRDTIDALGRLARLVDLPRDGGVAQ